MHGRVLQEQTAEQRQLQDSVRRFVADRYSFEARRKHLASGIGSQRACWRQFVEFGWVAAGLAPVRRDWDGLLPVPGAEGRYEWQGYLAMKDLPHVLYGQRRETYDGLGKHRSSTDAQAHDV